MAEISRPDKIQALPDWIDAAQSVAGRVRVILLGNKNDLDPSTESIKSFEVLVEEISAPHWLTSAKTGENVEAAFQNAAAAMVGNAQPRAVPAR